LKRSVCTHSASTSSWGQFGVSRLPWRMPPLRHVFVQPCSTSEIGGILRSKPFSCRLALCGPIATAGLFAFTIGPAPAGEAAYCVACTGPDQTYLCRVTGEGASQNDIFKLYCTVRTAKQGGHASCAATQKVESCHGKLKTYHYRGPWLPASLAKNPQVQRFMSRMEKDYSSKPKVTEATQAREVLPPVKASPRPSRFQRTVAAVGRFGRTSYRCLRSLFRNCSGEAQE
jgi:hypothetical protein